MKIIKWIAIFFAVVFTIAAGLAAVFITTFDVEQYRGRIEQEAMKATGRQLTLAGPIDLKISLNPALLAEDVTFANAAWGSRTEMVKVERMASSKSPSCRCSAENSASTGWCWSAPTY